MLAQPPLGVPPAARDENMSALLLSAGSLTLRTHTQAGQANCGIRIKAGANIPI